MSSIKANEFLDVIGNIDEELIRDAEPGSQKKGRTIKYISVAACLICLILAEMVFIHPFTESGNHNPNENPASPSSWNLPQNMDLDNLQTECDIQYFKGKIYYSDFDQGTFCMDTEKDVAKKISSHSGYLIKSGEELYCREYNADQVYQVRNRRMNSIGKIPENSVLIGVADNTLYWYSAEVDGRSMGIYQTNADNGKSKMILSLPEGLMGFRLREGSLYYQTGTGVICSYDLVRKKSELISREYEEKQYTESSVAAEQYFTSGKGTFFRNFAVIPTQLYKKDSNGGYIAAEDFYYQVNYRNGKTTPLLSREICSNFSLFKQKIYYMAVDSEDQITLESYNLKSGNSSICAGEEKLIPIKEKFEIRDIRIAVCKEKCYYAISAASGGGIYCYDFAADCVSMISIRK